MKKSKPKSSRDWTGILIGALIDLLIGTVLLIIGTIMNWAQRVRGAKVPHIYIIPHTSLNVKRMKFEYAQKKWMWNYSTIRFHARSIQRRSSLRIRRMPLFSFRASSCTHNALHEKPNLYTFLEDGNVPLDNNRAENAIRPFTLGRKNWMHCNTANGAKASAILYSIAATAQANGIDTEQYLTELFSKPAGEIILPFQT